jgi:hypothetical protein
LALSEFGLQAFDRAVHVSGFKSPAPERQVHFETLFQILKQPPVSPGVDIPTGYI